MMAGPASRPPVFVRFGQRLRSLLTHPALWQRLRQGAISLLLLLTLLCGPNGLLTNVSVSFAQTQASSPGKPNRFDPTQDAGSVAAPSATGTSDPNWKAGQPQPLTHSLQPLMSPGSLTLYAGQAATFLGSNGRLEVDVPASAVSASDQSQAGGHLTLLVTQIAPASGSSAGGSGHISLGTYLLQLVDSHGKRVKHGARAALTLKWHAGVGEDRLDLTHVLVVWNAALPAGTALAPAVDASTPTMGALSSQHATFDPAAETLAVTTTLTSSSTSLSYNTNSAQAAFGTPDLFNVGLNTGSLALTYPLDLPAGPNGQVPPLTLSYSSESVSEQHNVQGAAGWVGEGWSLSPGSISWAEHNVLAGVSGANWQSSWQLSDPYGTSAQLIPPNLATSTYYDDLGTSPSGIYESYLGPVWSSGGFNWASAHYLVGDVNGDGKADVIAAYDLGIQQGVPAVGLYLWLGTSTGLAYQGQVWSSVGDGTFNWASARWMVGDVTGDGKADVIAAYDLGTGSTGLYEWRSTGTGLTYQGSVWSSSGFTWANAKWAVGDVTGDGKADVIAAYDLGNSSTGLYEWQSTGTGLSYQGSVWSSGGFAWANAQFLVGDMNGDGKADVLAAYDLGNSTTGLYDWLSTGTGLSYQGQIWSASGFTASNAQWAVGDVTGDGKADVIALYNLGTQQGAPAVGLYEWFSTGSSVSYQGQIWSSVGRGGFSWASASLLAGDVTGDGKADLVALYDLGNTTTGAYEWATTGTYITNPVSWQTAPDTHAKTYSYWGPNQLPGAAIGPVCFRVFLPNGIMEEFGCTPDAIQYYYQQNGANAGKPYLTGWLLDLITDRNGNQIHFTYQADMATDPTGHSYPRDVVLSTVEWDSPTCQDTQQRCTGASWAPHLRVSFQASHTPTRLTWGPASGCNTGSNLRCDDPLDLTGSNGLGAPQVQSTWVLNDLLVQVNPSGTWQTLKDYQFSYGQSAPGSIVDPTTDQAESTAGALDLTQIQVFGDDGTTALPTSTFGYTGVFEHYEDDAYRAPAGDCGPSWNSGCLLWSQSYSGNSNYLLTADNGLGLHQVFSWAEARNNTHGVNGGGSNALNPLYCTNNPNGYPCNQADDQNWSHVVLTQEQDTVVRLSQDGQGGQQTSTPVQTNTYYSYLLTAYAANPCSDCLQGMYWGNQNDVDYLDYYNGTLMGFAQTTVTHSDGSREIHHYYSTLGWGLYDTSQVSCATPNPCHNDPWWDVHNALHGQEYELDQYNSPDAVTLLAKTTTAYSVQCPASGVGGTGSTSYGNFDGNLVSELDHNNPVAACDLHTSQVDTYTYDGSTASGIPHTTTTYQYDSYGRVTQTTTTSNNGGATGSPTTIVTTSAYIWNDAVNAAASSVTGTYLIDTVAFTDTEDASGNRSSCTFTSYDGQGYATGQQSSLAAGKATLTTAFTSCGTKATNFSDASGPINTTATYDTFGNLVATTDADAIAGIAGHTGCTIGSTAYTTCITYDPTFAALPTSSANALNQTSSISYSQTAGGGFGRWPTSATDANGQTATASYDALGRMTSQTLPGETSGLTTTGRSYTDFCGATGAQSPCVEIDSTQRLNDTTTVTSRAFYDGWGNLVETRSPGPSGQDVVQYYYYDTAGRQVFASLRYFVSAYTGAPGAAAYSIPDSTQNIGTTTTYTSLLSATMTDPLSHSSTSSSAVVCNQKTPNGGVDSACYVQSSAVDPLGHKQSSLTDALGREVYDQRYTGNSTSTYVLYTTTQYTYDSLGDLVQILYPGGTVSSTFQYDMLGRQTGMTDPDRGTESYSYDPNGNLLTQVDARGSAGTIYAGYDGLNRQLWRNTTNSASGAYVTYSYDSTANGNHGVGSLTGETFTNGSLTGSYSTVYDQRGQPISMTETVGSATYPSQATYDDAGDLLTKTYPDGEVVTTSYTPQAWLAGVSTQQGSTATTLLSNVAYNGTAGAGGLMTGASLGGGAYTYAASYDLLLRLTDNKMTRTSDNATLFEQAVTYDAAGNVSSLTTTLPQGTDQQQFCYDDQNRMTWAGAVGTPPCTGTAITPGSLTAAQYTQSYTFDTFNRLTSGSQGTYTYGDSHHLDAVTSISGGYTASYDAAGNMTCRAPTSATTCAGGTPTGAQSAYDNEGRLAHWQDTPSSPTTTESYLYDGAGNRVAQQVTGTTTSTTVYVGSLEEVTTSGATTTTTTYYYANGQRIALAVNGVFSYLCTDILGSVSLALDGSGHVQASQLFGPYGTVRYSSGTMPGSYGFTGQHADNATGLDYYNARYYDPAAGTFTSADTVPGEGYAYVKGNPETYTDPSGNDPPIPLPPPWYIPVLEAAIVVLGACIMFCAMAWGFYQSYNDINKALHPEHFGETFNNRDPKRARVYYPDAPLDPHEDLRHRIHPDPYYDPYPKSAPGPDYGALPDDGVLQEATIGGGTAAPDIPTPPIEAQNLPVRQSGDKTDCVVEPTGSSRGFPQYLSSRGGIQGPGVLMQYFGQPGFAGVPTEQNAHCEAQAIAFMILMGWQSANLWVNNTPCKSGRPDKLINGCADLWSQRLPTGWTLNVFVSDSLHPPSGNNDWMSGGAFTGNP